MTFCYEVSVPVGSQKQPRSAEVSGGAAVAARGDAPAPRRAAPPGGGGLHAVRAELVTRPSYAGV